MIDHTSCLWPATLFAGLNFSSVILLVVKVLELVPAAFIYAEGNTGSTLGEPNKSFEAIDLDDNAAADIGDD